MPEPNPSSLSTRDAGPPRLAREGVNFVNFGGRRLNAL